MCLGPGLSQHSCMAGYIPSDAPESISKLLPASWLLQTAELGTGVGAEAVSTTPCPSPVHEGPSMHQHEPRLYGHCMTPHLLWPALSQSSAFGRGVHQSCTVLPGQLLYLQGKHAFNFRLYTTSCSAYLTFPLCRYIYVSMYLCMHFKYIHIFICMYIHYIHSLYS